MGFGLGAFHYSLLYPRTNLCPWIKPKAQRMVLGCWPYKNNPLLEKHQRLSSTPLLEEIYHNVFSLPPLIAPGPDGNHAIFFQQNWHILGPGIIHAIQEIFETVTIPEDSGAINLVLIPKINHLYMITQFRLISLFNTLYKLLSRIILQRLKPYIVDIINSC